MKLVKEKRKIIMSGMKIYECLAIVIFLTMVNPQSPPLLTFDFKNPNKGAISDVALQGIYIGDLGAYKYTSPTQTLVQATITNVDYYTITAYRDETKIYACSFTNWSSIYKLAYTPLGVTVVNFATKCISIGVDNAGNVYIVSDIYEIYRSPPPNPYTLTWTKYTGISNAVRISVSFEGWVSYIDTSGFVKYFDGSNFTPTIFTLHNSPVGYDTSEYTYMDYIGITMTTTNPDIAFSHLNSSGKPVLWFLSRDPVKKLTYFNSDVGCNLITDCIYDLASYGAPSSYLRTRISVAPYQLPFISSFETLIILKCNTPNIYFDQYSYTCVATCDQRRPLYTAPINYCEYCKSKNLYMIINNLGVSSCVADCTVLGQFSNISTMERKSIDLEYINNIP